MTKCLRIIFKLATLRGRLLCVTQEWLMILLSGNQGKAASANNCLAPIPVDPRVFLLVLFICRNTPHLNHRRRETQAITGDKNRTRHRFVVGPQKSELSPFVFVDIKGQNTPIDVGIPLLSLLVFFHLLYPNKSSH